MSKTLADYMRESETEPFLRIGPTPPDGWVYRDFRAMPCDLWLALLDLVGDTNIQIVAANSRQLPRAPMCRAQIFVNSAGQAAWSEYLRKTAQ